MKRAALFLAAFFGWAIALGVNSQAQVREVYYVNDADRVVIPGTALVADSYLYGDPGKTRTLELYRLPLETHLAWIRKNGPVPAERVRALQLVGRKTVPVETPKEAPWVHLARADFGVQPPGEYAVVAASGEPFEYGQLALYNVGTLGTIWHAGGASMFCYALDLRTMRHRDDVVYTLETATGRDALVSMNGLSWHHGQLRSGVVVGRARDGSVTVQRLWNYGGANGPSGYIQTDRPIYRPGQHVYLRAIVRTGTIASLALVEKPQNVTVRSGDGTTLYNRKLAPDQFGAVHAEFDVPESAKLGWYEISAGGLRSTISVEAYKKPEYLLSIAPAKKYVVGGDDADFAASAKYFFGRPAAGMHLHYSARFQPRFWFFSPYDFMPVPRTNDGNAFVQGDTSAGADGSATVAVATKHVDFEETLQISVDGRDASGRTVSDSATVEVVPGTFRITAQPQRWYARTGDDVAFDLTTAGYDGVKRPNVPIGVEIAGTSYDYASHKERKVPLEKTSIATGDRGSAVFHWKPQAAASYEFTFTAKDERGNTVRTRQWLWVSAAGVPWWRPEQRITMIPDKTSYAPGEHAHVLLTVPQADADAIVSVSSDEIVSARVIHVGATQQTLDIAPPKNAMHYSVRVEVPGMNGVDQGNATLTVAPPPQQLRVSVTPEKAKYAPGERARFRLHVTDRTGRPVRAQLGVGVVDESIFAVQADHVANALDAFYGRQIYEASGASWQMVSNVPQARLKMIGAVRSASGMPAPLVKAGATADIYSVNGGVDVRSNFPDTAYWTPDTVTDARGNATIAFTWPDTLTTWRATGLAVTPQTQVGSASQTALVTKDFLVRLEMPRFLRRGDRSQFTGIVNGRAGAKNALLRLQAGDLTKDAAEQTVALDGSASGNASWNVNPLTSLGVREVTLAGGDGTLTDALKLTIPIEAAGAPEHVRDAAEVHDRATTAVSVPPMYDAGELRVTLSPSIVASLLQDVRLLDVYPYYCTEQTMSAALPAVMLERAFKRAGIAMPQDPSPGQIVNKAITRLAELQHDDGSWGWWKSDGAHPFMTAYALYGLAQFKDAGYKVPAPMFERGVNSLVAQLQTGNDDTLRLWGGRQPNSQWNTRAFMLFALAKAAPQRVDRALLAQTRSHEESLNDYALAVLGIAEHDLGDDASARSILARLNAHAVHEGAYAFWLGQTWHYAWQDDPIETTAYALRLNDLLDPQSQLGKDVSNFLRAQHRGDWWYTTKDTAAAVDTLAQREAAQSATYHPDETVTVSVNGAVLKSVHVTEPVLTQRDATLTVPASLLGHGGDVRIAASGRGMLYWSTDFTRYAPPYARKTADAEESILARLRARPSSFAIDRTYRAKNTPWHVGDEIEVDVTVHSDSDTDYVAVEDPFPAGAEYQPLQGRGGENWSGIQFFDDRAVFFADHLYAGYPLHLRYALRVTTPGTYTAAPPTAYAMYGPPVSAAGQPERITVR